MLKIFQRRNDLLQPILALNLSFPPLLLVSILLSFLFDFFLLLDSPHPLNFFLHLDFPYSLNSSSLFLHCLCPFPPILFSIAHHPRLSTVLVVFSNSRDPSCRLDLITKEAGNPNSREAEHILSYLATNQPGGSWCYHWKGNTNSHFPNSCSNPHSSWFDLVRGTRNLNSSRGVKSCHILQATIQTDGN